VSEPAAVVETHTAVVVFVGGRAYKLKKPVDLGFVDFSTVAARAAACRREVELNRRLAPDVYLGVADVVGPDGAVCDHLVVMRRMPADRRLSTCIERGEDVVPALRTVARDIAALHESSEPDAAWSFVASVERVRANWDDNFAAMRPFAGRVFDHETLTRVELLVHRYLDGRRPLFEQRIADGRVRDGHGDLQADDIFVLDDGPRVLDCLEFSDELRHGDVVNDVAFLAMDLERLGRADLAARFLDWHREFTADTWPASLADHYIAYRADVRAKVTAIRVEQGDEHAKAWAARFLDLAVTHLEQARVRLILVGGLPGTGKSALSDALAARLAVTTLRTDELRAGERAARSAPYGEGRYTEAAVRETYEQLLDRARTLLELGESVVLDASWSSAALRERARQLASTTASDVVELRCEAPAAVAAERIAARNERGTDASEATPEIAEEMAHRFDAWPGATTIDTTVPLDDSTDRASALVRDALLG
jgi:aminoglycoside phosphotransferase family enzyme/predicted kinase